MPVHDPNKYGYSEFVPSRKDTGNTSILEKTGRQDRPKSDFCFVGIIFNARQHVHFVTDII